MGPNLGHRVCLEPALSKDNLGPGVLSLHQASRSLSHLLPPRASHPFLIRMQILMDLQSPDKNHLGGIYHKVPGKEFLPPPSSVQDTGEIC